LLLPLDILCALSFAVLAGLLALHSKRGGIVIALVIACGATALWALATGLRHAPVGWPTRLLPALDVVQLSAWVGFLGAAFFGGRTGRSRSPWVPGIAVLALLLLANALYPRPEPLRAAAIAHLCGLLGLAILGLVVVEALVRRARAEAQDRTRYLCLGVGALLATDVLTWSQALLFQSTDVPLLELRPTMKLLAVPLIGVGAARNHAWATELNLARRAVVHSATLFVTGGYLFGLAVVGAVLKETGGEWGAPFQALFLFAGGLALILVWASPSVRSALRLQLGRYLFTHRHDYREQWERFATALSTGEDASARSASALWALVDLIGSRQGALWLRDGDAFVLTASRGLEAASVEQIPEGPFTGWVESLGRSVRKLGLDDGPVDPFPRGLAWGWLVVPLVRERLVGFALLSRPRGRSQLHVEDEEILSVAAMHVASSLLADQRARRLAEVQRFEEVSRGLAFVAHDLRNVANELTLTLANARRHITRPEFQRDLILSMEESVQSMQKLLDKVARRRIDAPREEPVDLVQMVRGTVLARRGGDTELLLELVEGVTLPVVCDPEGLASVSGHMVQNAIDAAGPKGRVTVRVSRVGEEALLEVQDDGEGMAPELLRDRLRHPFQSTKANGFGLGLYECREVAHKLGGEFAMESSVGQGSVARLRLPLAGADTRGARVGG
jgi:putative PEP-CTERM system histidine kinase